MYNFQLARDKLTNFRALSTNRVSTERVVSDQRWEKGFTGGIVSISGQGATRQSRLGARRLLESMYDGKALDMLAVGLEDYVRDVQWRHDQVAVHAIDGDPACGGLCDCLGGRRSCAFWLENDCASVGVHEGRKKPRR